jgi:hypothetical protein
MLINQIYKCVYRNLEAAHNTALEDYKRAKSELSSEKEQRRLLENELALYKDRFAHAGAVIQVRQQFINIQIYNQTYVMLIFNYRLTSDEEH